MHVDGACHCGEIAFTAVVDPAKVVLCHCTDCQALSGSAFRANIGCAANDFQLVRGEPKLYVKIAESGTQRVQAFCPTCGAQVYACAVGDDPGIYSLRTGTLKQRAAFAPARQIWQRSAVPWARDLVKAPGYPGEASVRREEGSAGAT